WGRNEIMSPAPPVGSGSWPGRPGGGGGPPRQPPGGTPPPLSAGGSASPGQVTCQTPVPDGSTDLEQLGTWILRAAIANTVQEPPFDQPGFRFSGPGRPPRPAGGPPRSTLTTGCH